MVYTNYRNEQRNDNECEEMSKDGFEQLGDY